MLRDGSRQEVDALTLVPGDVLLLEEGDRISADGRLITAGEGRSPLIAQSVRPT